MNCRRHWTRRIRASTSRSTLTCPACAHALERAVRRRQLSVGGDRRARAAAARRGARARAALTAGRRPRFCGCPTRADTRISSGCSHERLAATAGRPGASGAGWRRAFDRRCGACTGTDCLAHEVVRRPYAAVAKERCPRRLTRTAPQAAAPPNSGRAAAVRDHEATLGRRGASAGRIRVPARRWPAHPSKPSLSRLAVEPAKARNRRAGRRRDR